MKKEIIFAICGVSLAAAAAGGYYQFKVRPIEDAKDAVRAQLKDPASAIFHEVKVNKENGAACGLVNAKNAMGGYVGKRGFLKTSGGDVELEPSGEAYGSTAAKIEALQAQIAFIEKVQKECGIEPSKK